MVDVLKKINDLRIKKGWSIYKLAEEAGLTQSTLSNMITRNSTPNIKTLEQICEAFGISLAEFFSENSESSDAEALTLITNYKSLCKRDQELIKNLINDMKKTK